MKPFPVVLSSPSGGGKSTIAKALLEARDDLGYSVSATTRKPRPGEAEGKDYYFLKRKDFEAKVAAGEFVESAEYGGELYGTLKSEVQRVLDGGQHVVLDIEIQGAREVKRLYHDAVLVFIVPPSADELLKRLGGTEGTRAANLEQRMQRAVVELNEALQYDYVVVNADRTEAVADVAAILDAEARRPKHAPDLSEQLGQLGRDILVLLDRIKAKVGG